mmetsp:Transcript_8109/g.30081  ORF Transcript_8109/g.30081 Transcript_8109/m.30081 type:complete len:81 (+) Transcript_8109:238-480(+)
MRNDWCVREVNAMEQLIMMRMMLRERERLFSSDDCACRYQLPRHVHRKENGTSELHCLFLSVRYDAWIDCACIDRKRERV